jgi:hypothetical protein
MYSPPFGRKFSGKRRRRRRAEKQWKIEQKKVFSLNNSYVSKVVDLAVNVKKTTNNS